MNRDEARREAKNSLKDRVSSKHGRNTDKLFRCLNKDHEDKKPSMSYDEGRNKIKCFSGACGVDWDIFDLIGNEYGLTDDKAKFDKTYEVLGINIDHSTSTQHTIDFKFDNIEASSLSGNSTPSAANNITDDTDAGDVAELKSFLLRAQSNINDPKCIDYLRKRSINIETAKRHGLGFIQDWQHPKLLKEGKNPRSTPRIIIPKSNNSYLARDIRDDKDVPDFQKSYVKSKVGTDGVFNIGALAGHEPCFVVEGEFDALSFIEVGFNAVSLGSTSSVASFIAKVKALPSCCPLILALDSDAAGVKAKATLVGTLKKNNIKYNIFDMSDYKDPNEFLCNDGEAFETSARECFINFNDKLSDDAQSEADEFDVGKQTYLQTRVDNHIDAFRNSIKSGKDKPVLSTGFKKLDKVLGGGLYAALYGIGAITSLGKTTLVIQIADHLASQGHDVLYFSLEMSRYEIMAKSISRHTRLYCKELAKSTREILDGRLYDGYTPRECEVIYTAEEHYRKYSNKLFIYEAVGDLGVVEIRRAIEDHIKYMGRTPVVVVDYLQILAPANLRATDKQNTDKAVLELKKITRDFNMPVIAISSLNRQSYKDAISLQAFKESGAIEYSSDVLIGLQLKDAGEDTFNVDEAKRAKERKIELKVLKNRNGQTGDSIEFEYQPRENMFEEIGIM